MVIRIPKAQVRKEKLKRRLKVRRTPVYSCDDPPVFKRNHLTGEVHTYT